jgi:hypothetical protein
LLLFFPPLSFTCTLPTNLFPFLSSSQVDSTLPATQLYLYSSHWSLFFPFLFLAWSYILPTTQLYLHSSHWSLFFSYLVSAWSYSSHHSALPILFYWSLFFTFFYSAWSYSSHHSVLPYSSHWSLPSSFFFWTWSYSSHHSALPILFPLISSPLFLLLSLILLLPPLSFTYTLPTDLFPFLPPPQLVHVKVYCTLPITQFLYLKLFTSQTLLLCLTNLYRM